jgi:hypothetical protein
MLAATLRRIAGDLIPDLTPINANEPALEPTCG